MFDAHTFLKEQFHNAQHVASTLRAYGFVVTPAAVEKWFQRGSVPGSWLSVLIAIKEIETGGPIRVSQYLKSGGSGK